MNELSDAPEMGGTEETPAVETHSEATTEQAEAGSSELADDAGEETEAPKRVPWFQKRIDEVTRQKYDAQREADYWRGLAEGRGSQPQAAQPAQQVPDRWEDPEGYDQWLISQAVERTRQEFKQEQTSRTYQERVESFRASKPDFDQVAFDPTLPVSQDMAKVIADSERGPELLYHLGTNRSEAARIAQLPPHLQAAALGRIEASLATPSTPAPRRNPPPPPPQTVSGLSAGISKAPEDMSMAEYVAARKAGNV